MAMRVHNQTHQSNIALALGSQQNIWLYICKYQNRLETRCRSKGITLTLAEGNQIVVRQRLRVVFVGDTISAIDHLLGRCGLYDSCQGFMG